MADAWAVDTNVVVAGLLTDQSNSPPAVILDAMLEGRVRFVLSVELLTEYRTVLLRQQVRKRHGLNETEVDQLLHSLADNAIIVDITGRDEIAPDRGDNHLWRLLAARHGTGLISGDAKLLQQPPPGIPALSPREWIEKD